MIQKQEQLAKEQYRFINYLIYISIIIQFVYGVINFMFNEFYITLLNSVNIFAMLTVVLLIKNTAYNFDVFAKKAILILVLAGNVNIFFTWYYTHFIFLYNVVMLLAINYIFFFFSAVYFAASFVIMLLFMITGTHYYDLSITMHKTKEFVNAVEYSTIVLAISLNLVYIFSFQKLHRLKAQIELLEELEKKKNEELIATKKEIADAALPDKFDNLYDEIIAYFENEKPWQHPEFNLNKLTTALNSNVAYVSSKKKKKGKKNFNSLVNEYRIEHVKKAINNGEYKKFTIKHLYTEAGFVNQSTFNRIFKQMEGISPQEYIEKQIS